MHGNHTKSALIFEERRAYWKYVYWTHCRNFEVLVVEVVAKKMQGFFIHKQRSQNDASDGPESGQSDMSPI